MMKRLLAIGGVATLLLSVRRGQPPTRRRPRRCRPPPRQPRPQVPPQRALLNRYCVSCHSQRAKAAGLDSARKLTLDDLDLHASPRTRSLGTRRAQAARGHDAAGRLAPARQGHLRRLDLVARERARPHRRALHAAARPASLEPHRVRQRDPRPARSRHRSRRRSCHPTIRRTASTTSPARSAFRRRSSRRTSRPPAKSAGWRSANRRRRRWWSTGRPKTRRRTTTSKGCRSARAAACS